MVTPDISSTVLEALPGVPSDIQVLAGPLFIGYCLNWGLYGVLSIQMYMYYLAFNDAWQIKSLVWGLYLVDTLQTALTTHNGWHFLSAGWGDPEALIKPGWSWIAVPLFSGLVSATVQIFFAWRIAKLSQHYWISIPIVLLALAQGISGAVSGIWFSIINDVTKISDLFPSATVWLAGSAVNDIMIATVMVRLLRSRSSGLVKTDALIDRLVRMTVETGAITAVAATLELIFYLKWKENNLHMIPALALAKLYSNSMLANLNARNPSYRSSQDSDDDRVQHITSSVVGRGGKQQQQQRTIGGSPRSPLSPRHGFFHRRASAKVNVTTVTVRSIHADDILEATDPERRRRVLRMVGSNSDISVDDGKTRPVIDEEEEEVSYDVEERERRKPRPDSLTIITSSAVASRADDGHDEDAPSPRSRSDSGGIESNYPSGRLPTYPYFSPRGVSSASTPSSGGTAPISAAGLLTPPPLATTQRRFFARRATESDVEMGTLSPSNIDREEV